MANTDDTSSTAMPPTGDAEMTALATRLRNRADSVMYRDQPHQAADLRAAASIIMTQASLIRRLVHVTGELGRMAQETTDDSTAQQLRELLRGR